MSDMIEAFRSTTPFTQVNAVATETNKPIITSLSPEKIAEYMAKRNPLKLLENAVLDKSLGQKLLKKI